MGADQPGAGTSPDSDSIALAETVAPTSSAPGIEPISGLEATVAPTSSAPGSVRAREVKSDLRTVDPADYEIGDEIARGGMGRIRRANDMRLGRPVAVKELLATEPEMAVRFLREIRLTARLQHPSIVSVYEAGKWPSGEMFFAMRIVPGQSLDAVVAPLKTLAQRLALVPNVIAIVEALAYAHDQRIVHRDLKPGNILIGPFGETVVIDWGLGKDLEGDDSLPPTSEFSNVAHGHADSKDPDEATTAPNLTMVGSVMGTPAYMPPEQAAGEVVDERADVYALGAILYHVLAGRPPFVAKKADELLIKVLSKKPAPLAGIDQDIPPDLIAIVEKAMAREPGDRYASARELAADLRRFHTGQLVGAHSYSWMHLVRRWVRKNLAAVIVGAAAVVALAVIATILVRNIVRERDRAEAATKVATRERSMAVAARDQAEIAAARLHFDQARQELLAGNPLRAAALGHAALAGEDTAAARLVVGAALQTLDPQMRRFEGLAEPIVASGFLPDGAHAFAVTQSGKVRLWNVATGALTKGFERPGKLLTALVSSDAKLLVLVGEESVFELWDIETGKLARTITIEGGAAQLAMLSRDNSKLAIGGDGITIWNPATGAKIAELPVNDTLVSSLKWTADGTSLVVADNGGGISIIDTATWRPRMSTSVGGVAFNDCSLSGDGKLVACIWSDGGAILDAKGGAFLRELDGPGGDRSDSYRFVEWSSSGKSLAISTAGDHARLLDARTGHTLAVYPSAGVVTFISESEQLMTFGPTGGRVAIWDSSGQRLVDELAGHGRPLAYAAVSPDSKSLLTASDDGTVSVWRLVANTATSRTPLVAASRTMRYIAKDEVLVTAGVDGTVDAYATATGDRLRGLGTKVDSLFDSLVEVLPDGRVIALVAPDKLVLIWDPRTGTIAKTFPISGAVTKIGASLTGDRIWAATATSLHVWDAGSAIEIGTFPHAEMTGDSNLVGGHAATTVTTDGTRALVPVDGGLAIVDIASKRELGKMLVAGDVWSTITDGDRVVVVSASGATLFDLATSARIGSPIAQGEVLSDARFTDGALYTQSNDGVIRRWDPTTGTLTATFNVEPEGTLVFAVQPKGALLATFADDRVVVWDTRSGKELVERSTFLSGPSQTLSLAFSAHDEITATSVSPMRWTWRLPTWRGTLDQLDARLACDVPWQLVDGTLSPRTLAATCAKP